MSLLDEFKKFVSRGSVVDLAIGVVIGAAFGAITTSLVEDIFTPLLAVVGGGMDFSARGIILRDADKFATVAEAIEAGVPVLLYGKFINAVLNFFLVSAVMFGVVKAVNRLKDMREKEEQDPASPAEPPRDIVILTEIRDLLAEGRREA